MTAIPVIPDAPQRVTLLRRSGIAHNRFESAVTDPVSAKQRYRAALRTG